ncbi:MAG: dTMP kinase [Rhodospirillales bacterium]
MSGRLIVLEGGEGSGKSTQCGRLAERLRARGLEVVRTREPGGTEGAEEVRRLLVEGAATRWDSWSELLLVYAARRDHVSRVIEPALARGAWVVCDRFVHSTLAYQGIVGGLGVEAVVNLHRLALGRLWPDQVLLLDLPVAEGLARAQSRGGAGRFESKGLAFHEALRAAFLTLLAAEPATCRRLDASGSEDAVAARVAAAVEVP